MKDTYKLLLLVLLVCALFIPLKCFASFGSPDPVVPTPGECNCCCEDICCEGIIEETPARKIKRKKKGMGHYQLAPSASDSLNNTFCSDGMVNSDAVTKYLTDNCPELVTYVKKDNIMIKVDYYSGLSEGASLCGYSSCEKTPLGTLQRVIKLRVCDVGNNGCSPSHGTICNPCDALEHEITHFYKRYCRSLRGPCDSDAREVLIQNDAYTKCKKKRSGAGPIYDPQCVNAKSALYCYCTVYHEKGCSSSNEVLQTDKDAISKICPTPCTATDADSDPANGNEYCGGKADCNPNDSKVQCAWGSTGLCACNNDCSSLPPETDINGQKICTGKCHILGQACQLDATQTGCSCVTPTPTPTPIPTPSPTP